MPTPQPLAWFRSHGTLDPPAHMRWYTIMGVVLGGALTVVVSTLEDGYLLPLGILALAYVIWSFRRPLVALSTILLLYLYLVIHEEGISFVEVGFALYTFGYIVTYFFRALILERRRVLHSAADYLLVTFLLICTASGALVVSGGGSLVVWLKELLRLAELLLYFPLRDAMGTKRDVAVLLGAALLMIGTVAVYNIVTYRTSSLIAGYIWQLIQSRRAFGDHFFFPATVVLMSLVVHEERVKQRRIFTALLLFIGVALTLTFSRGFWLATGCGVLLLMVMGNRRMNTRILLTGGSTLLLALGAIVFATGSVGLYVIAAIFTRFASAGSALADISVTNRFLESSTVLSAIAESPLVGYGIGAMFHRYDLIARETVVTNYVHNGYLYLLFKVGIVGAAVLLCFFAANILRALRMSSRLLSDTMLLALVRGVGASLFCMLIVTVTSNVFIERQSIVLISLGTAFLGSQALERAGGAARGGDR